GDFACQSNASKAHISRDLSAPSIGDERKWRLQGKPAPSSKPVDVEAQGTTARVSTSLQHVHKYFSDKDLEKRAGVGAFLPDDIELPEVKPARPPRLDIWTRTEVTDVPDASTTRSMTGRVGMDYKLKANTLIGARIETNSLDQGTSGPNETGVLAGPYVATKIAPGLTLEADSAFGTARTQFNDQGETSSNRRHVRAGLKGDWKLKGYTFAPSAHVTHLRDTSQDSGGPAIERRALEINPKLKRTFETTTGTQITPFVDYTTTLDLEAVAAPGVSQTSEEIEQRLGAGVTISKSDAFDLNATADLERIDGAQARNVRSKLRLDVPLN
ncbi:MAG: hypothetical protein AAFR75_08395, partial [Pseudomonadota bacterium]